MDLFNNIGLKRPVNSKIVNFKILHTEHADTLRLTKCRSTLDPKWSERSGIF